MRCTHRVLAALFSLLVLVASAHAAGRGTQRFDLHASGHIVVPAEINGHRVHMVVDTGAGRTVVHADAAARLGLDGNGGEDQQAIGAGGAGLAIRSLPGQSFRLAATGDDAMTLYVMDLSHVVNALSTPERPIVGVVGADWLAAKRAVIDYGTRTLVVPDQEQRP